MEEIEKVKGKTLSDSEGRGWHVDSNATRNGLFCQNILETNINNLVQVFELSNWLKFAKLYFASVAHYSLVQLRHLNIEIDFIWF